MPLVEHLLKAQGFIFEEEPFFPLARRLVHEPFPLGASLAAIFGYIYIQDRSSMLPPIVLAPESGSSVLDMCASPGSKTGLLAQLVEEGGFVLGNEPSRNRLATLRRNMLTLNLLQCSTMSYPGESLPFNANSTGWPYILLDPPCSGWGTVEKNPQVMSLWQGDKVKPLIALQRKLLAEATRLLRIGGRVVYSTCTTNREENEDQLQFACEELGLRFIPHEPLPGFSFADPLLADYAGSLRVETGEDGQGFFVALLEKIEATQDIFTEGETGLNDPAAVAQPRLEKKQRHRSSRRQSVSLVNSFDGERLPLEAISSPWVDITRIPAGEIAVFSSVAHFLPEGSRGLVPEGAAWKGFPLGRLSGGMVRVNPALHTLMPDMSKAEKEGLAYIDVDSPEYISALLTGQSMAVEAPGPEAGLYFCGLPLCRLTVKGKRAMLPPL